jgi:hypothetical protein
VAAFGMGLGWFGYALAGWGYILIKGYDVKFTDWINPLHQYKGGWPPPLIDDPTVLLPDGAAGAAPGDPSLTLPPDPFGTPAPTGKQVTAPFPKVKPGK